MRPDPAGQAPFQSITSRLSAVFPAGLVSTNPATLNPWPCITLARSRPKLPAPKIKTSSRLSIFRNVLVSTCAASAVMASLSKAGGARQTPPPGSQVAEGCARMFAASA